MMRAIGVEIDPVRVLFARLFIALRRVRGKAVVVWGDLYQFDLADTDVVTIFLTRPTNDHLRTHFEQRLRPGARVVSYSFPIEGWTPVIIDDRDIIFVYEVGNTGEDVRVEFA